MIEETYPCHECREEVDPRRFKIGYRTCLKCGEKSARVEMKRKFKRVGLAYNKGPYAYITPADDPKALGRK